MRVFVNGQQKGDIERNRFKRFVWFRPNGSKEDYVKSAAIEDVKHHIARVCRVNFADVEIEGCSLSISKDPSYGDPRKR